MTLFQDFGLAEPIARAVAEEKYATPTPIQAQTIPKVCHDIEKLIRMALEAIDHASLARQARQSAKQKSLDATT